VTLDALFPYQEFGASWLAPLPFAILGDEQRVGKTPQAIRAAETVASRVGVVCPASAIGVWEAAIDRWSLGMADYSIQSYDNATDHGLASRCDTYIFDEAHRLGHITSARTQALLGHASPTRRAARVWALSGTIIQNHVGELYPWLRFAGLVDTTYSKYLARFCNTVNTEWGVRVMSNKKKALPELQAILAPVFLRRTRSQVYPDQPPISWGDISLRVENDENCVNHIANEIVIPDTMPTEDEHIARLKRQTGEAKAPALARFLADELEAGDQKLVIYAWHETVLDILEAGLAKFGVARIDGSVPQGGRRGLVSSFVTGDQRVFLGQIVAAGEAIDLCPANNLVLAEMSWNPEENGQALARILGPNQTLPVLIRTATLRGSLDDATNGVNARKTRMVTEAYGLAA
jgi:SWI/SNF-related matrix-associated actin-dependent regulator 1 of chromatin subfamily A